jgi:hypothetical protein
MKKIKKAAAIAASAGTVAVGGLFILKNAADKKRFVSWGEKKESKSGTVKDFKITSPYAEVDWDSWLSLKGNLHTHSTASDAGVDFADMIEAFYKQDFDILCMTDHGVINHGWNKPPQRTLFSFQSYFKKPRYLSDERYNEILTGADRGGRGMLDVKECIEINNAVLTKSHVNGFFTNVGQGKRGRENDFERPVRAVEASGGISHINHPGDWIDSFIDIKNAKDPRNIKFFADIFRKYKSCVGMEVFNRIDYDTCADRVLWDELLKTVIPYGRNVFGFSNSDAHSISDIDTSFGTYVMKENTIENLRHCMETGAFFAVTRFAKMELGEDFEAKGDYPRVTRITVDDENDIITLEGTNYNKIQWIADGEIIAEGESIKLRDYSDKISCYVRAQLIGDGGICLTQAFILDDGTLGQTLPFGDDTKVEQFLDKSVFRIRSFFNYVLAQELLKSAKRKVEKRFNH